MIFKSIEFAAKAHAGQYRKGTQIPYMIHPLGVAKILIQYDYPEHIVIAGVLHDTIEDTRGHLSKSKRDSDQRLQTLLMLPRNLTNPMSGRSVKNTPLNI